MIEDLIISDRLALADARDILAKLYVEIGSQMSYISELERNILNMELRLREKETMEKEM